jgi:hypothetical protein
MMTTMALLLALAAPAGGTVPDCGLVPGWTREGEPRHFDPETLFDYMNGNSEGYFAYGFVEMSGVTCTDDAGRRFVIDVSEMGDPDRAWGFFVANRDIRSPDDAIGAAGQVLARRATFAKGRYYAEIAASPEGDHREALRAFAVALAARIPGRDTPPDAIAWFPKDRLVAGSIRLVPESVLGIRALKSGYLAQYPTGRAFVVPTGSPEEAAATLATLRERFEGPQPTAGLGDEAFTGHDRYLGPVVVFREGARVAGVANVPEGADAMPLARALASTLP